MPATLVLFAGATIVGGIGLVAFASAPPEANAMTAIIIPAVMAMLMSAAGVAVLVFGRKGTGPARKAVLGAVVLVVLLAAMTLMPALARTRAWNAHNLNKEEFAAQVQAGTLQDTKEARDAFFRPKGAATHDITYLIAALWSIFAVHGVTAGLLLAMRPRKE
jgi:hypothetical protein